jgi:hypothetical protein
MGLERGPLSLVGTSEELLGRKSSGCGLEIREYSHRDPLWRPCGTLYPQKLAIISPTSGGRSVGIVCSQTQAMEFSFLFFKSVLSSLLSKTYFSSESTDTELPLLVDEDFCNSDTPSSGISSSDSQPPPAWPGTCAETVKSDLYAINAPYLLIKILMFKMQKINFRVRVQII